MAVLIRRVAYATLISGFVWVVAFVPLPVGVYLSALLFVVARWLDLPVALVIRLHIPYVSGVDLWFGQGVGEFMTTGAALVWHLRVSVPIYTAILYGLAPIGPLVARARKRLRDLQPRSRTSSPRLS